MAAVRYLGFSITWFWAIGRLGFRFSIVVPNLVKKMLVDAEIMAQNRNPRWRPSAILDFRKPDFWALAAYFPSWYQIWCNSVDRGRNYGPTSKSKMAAVRHLGFATSSYRTTHEVFSLGHIGLSNCMLIRCIVLKTWRFEFFCRFGLKYAPKILGFGGLNP